MSSKLITRLLLSSCALVFAGSAFAADDQDNAGYLGLRVGSDLDDRFPSGPYNVETDTPYSIYGGWNFHSHWGLELGYTDVGDIRAVGIADAGFELDANLWTLGVQYRQPFAERFELVAGAGIYQLNEDGHLLTIAGQVPYDNNETGIQAEVGVRFHFDGPLALRASYQWFDFDGGGDGTPWLGFEFGF